MRKQKAAIRASVTALSFICLFLSSCSRMTDSGTMNSQDPTDWFEDAKFGMFIHWSIPSVPENQWQQIVGRPRDPVIDRETMWSMRRGCIPVETYEKLAAVFNPTQYDADAFAQTAKAAGMKYIVITAKHHDGFAIFDSKVSQFDVVDATPYGKDILADLARACKTHGLKLCFYYSHAQDWHHPGGAGNDWDFKPEEKDFEKYFEQKCKPQVRELLTNYGPVGLMWFDTPAVINPDQSRQLYQMVKSIQPNCLVNSRVGHGYGDYLSTGDNQIPMAVTQTPWEVPATINDHWSWQTNQRYKDPADTIRKLVDIVSRGGNYLLNVGPDPNGRIPPQSVVNLAEMGRWLKVNGPAIYGTSVNPFHHNFDWGVATAKTGCIFLHVTDWPKDKIVLPGIRNPVRSCYLLCGGKKLKFSHDPANNMLSVTLPDKPVDPYVTVIAIEIDGTPDIDTTCSQQPDGIVEMPASGLPLTFGRHGFSIETVAIDGTCIHTPYAAPQMSLSTTGAHIENWLDIKEWPIWEFKIDSPGHFRLIAVTAKKRVLGDDNNRIYIHPGGHEVTVSIDRQKIKGRIEPNEHVDDPQEVITDLGEVSVPTPGKHYLIFKADTINPHRKAGLMLQAVWLVPVD